VHPDFHRGDSTAAARAGQYRARPGAARAGTGWNIGRAPAAQSERPSPSPPWPFERSSHAIPSSLNGVPLHRIVLAGFRPRGSAPRPARPAGDPHEMPPLPAGEPASGEILSPVPPPVSASHSSIAKPASWSREQFLRRRRTKDLLGAPALGAIRRWPPGVDAGRRTPGDMADGNEGFLLNADCCKLSPWSQET